MKKISVMILLLVVTMVSCKKTPEVNLKYVDVERDLITVGTTTATVQCDYKYITTLKKAYFYYGVGTEEIDMNTAEMRVVQNTLYVDLAGLRENTTYSYYYEFVNGFNSMRSTAKTFKTEASPVTPPDITLPTVITAMATEITANSAKGGGEVTNNGGAEVTERGICWSTNENPTLNNNHISAGSGTGEFIAIMDDLQANTTYHVRAYATNEKGTAYGLDREFATLSSGGGGGTGEAPIGAINGLFTINENGDQVYFSQGNLQYQASTNTWRFAENQWNYVGGTDYFGNHYGNVVGSSNNHISSTCDEWIDLFGWGTSGWNNGNFFYQPFDYETYNHENYGYGPTDGTNYNFDLTGDYANADWGVYNPISNGGNVTNTWRTLTRLEWDYVFNTRITVSGMRYAKAKLNDVEGVILLPDNWDANTFNLIGANESCPYHYNTISITDWIILENAGAVFLPGVGWRHYTEFVPCDGGYYSASCYYDASSAYYIGDCAYELDLLYCRTNSITRFVGCSVRLAKDAVQQVSNYFINVSACPTSGGLITGFGMYQQGQSCTVSATANPTYTFTNWTENGIVVSTEANYTFTVLGNRTLMANFVYNGSGTAPIGAINGLFSVSDSHAVYFSQGNLQYQPSTNTWRFADKQYDYVGVDNAYISQAYSGWIDLFGWGTSGWNSGNTYYHPWDTNDSYDASFLFGPPGLNHLTGIYANADWGVYNSILNGGNIAGQWRTLTQPEWEYILEIRNTFSGIHYAKAKVNGANGVILLPDFWDASSFALNNTDDENVPYSFNTISESQWIELENLGAVFLPAAGYRNIYSQNIESIGEQGRYWSASSSAENHACLMTFVLASSSYSIERNCGLSVRLVQDSNK